jgi:hypothetical protein
MGRETFWLEKENFGAKLNKNVHISAVRQLSLKELLLLC